jgi:hypothetical protein
MELREQLQTQIETNLFHLSARGEPTVMIPWYRQSATYECRPSPGRLTTCLLWFAVRYSDDFAELSEEQHPFRNDRVSLASLVSEFLVATANLIHPSEHRNSTVCISTVRILRAEHNVVTFTSFEQKESDDGPLFLFDVHCHFSDSVI